MAGGLEGRRIVVPESRELDLFAGMLERQGATTIRCPLVTILDLDDPAPAEAWLRRLADGAFDDVILFTGEGLRRLMDIADKAGFAEAATAALARTRKIVRGPKPVKALRAIGLGPDVTAAEPTSAGLIETLSGLDLRGRRVGMQAYPGQSPDLDEFLGSAGASVDRVLPYRYASHEEDRRVAAVIDEMASGTVDLIAFTARPQIKRLREVAERHGREEALAEAMRRTRIAAVGPIVGRTIEEAGWRVAVAPEESFHLKPMIATMRALFEDAGSPAGAR
ncbi:uroporphyrinogen-III synthase [Enterovirga rhinocerotis]|uniref:Uroporphyrinogen-III synthase n=1 Tax=Enterovirga rhinocerotis TaxID=1339210 RepID=A0A4R7CDK6_9HYPH|nr:uroporphyrinogen-III synthase [Enterovirga rhinocerotis]TDR94917.1 uroporphyrinogen-III synthase [Enterovirga rhinocerotis]